MSKEIQSSAPVFSHDILAPPSYSAPPGQLISWSATTSQVTDKFNINGADSQVVQITLNPGEHCCSEPGAMMYKAEHIKLESGLGDCASAFKRWVSGESMFRNKYINKGPGPEVIALTPEFPAKIIPIDLSRSGPFAVHHGAYIGHIGDVKVTFTFVKSFSAGCCGGQGFLMQRLVGTGTVFIVGGGTIMEKMLAPQETLLVDTISGLGFSQSCGYEIRRVGGCMACMCGGEGMFNAAITGPGLVIVQSMSKRRLIQCLSVTRGAGNSSSSGGNAAAS